MQEGVRAKAFALSGRVANTPPKPVETNVSSASQITNVRFVLCNIAPNSSYERTVCGKSGGMDASAMIGSPPLDKEAKDEMSMHGWMTLEKLLLSL